MPQGLAINCSTCPAFASPTFKAFLANLKMLAKTTDAGEGLKKGLSAVMQTVDAALETVGFQSPTSRRWAAARHPGSACAYSWASWSGFMQAGSCSWRWWAARAGAQ